MIDYARTQSADTIPATRGLDIDWYDARTSGRPRAAVPVLTVRFSGDISLNRIALEALGNPMRLRIGYSAAHRMIAIRAAREGERGSLRGTASKANGGAYGINAASFFKQHDIAPPQTTRFQSTRSVDGVLLFPLDNGEVVGRRQNHD